MGPDPFRGYTGPAANTPSVPTPPTAPISAAPAPISRPTAPIQSAPPPMPTMPRPVAPVQPMPRPMLQTPAQPDQVRQQLMTALTPRPRFSV
jgi:hypothetical protein